MLWENVFHEHKKKPQLYQAQTKAFETRQSMFVKHVPPLWAYFIEATKL